MIYNQSQVYKNGGVSATGSFHERNAIDAAELREIKLAQKENQLLEDGRSVGLEEGFKQGHTKGYQYGAQDLVALLGNKIQSSPQWDNGVFTPQQSEHPNGLGQLLQTSQQIV